MSGGKNTRTGQRKWFKLITVGLEFNFIGDLLFSVQLAGPYLKAVVKLTIGPFIATFPYGNLLLKLMVTLAFHKRQGYVTS